MTVVHVSAGSNIRREYHIRRGVELMREAFGELELSSVYETEAVGFRGAPFFNLVARFSSAAPVQSIVEALRAIERRCGRWRKDRSLSSRTLDLDLLSYGDAVLKAPGMELPRPETTTCAFVLKPLAELSGSAVHPTLGRTYAELWSAFPFGEQKIWLADFQLNGRGELCRTR